MLFRSPPRHKYTNHGSMFAVHAAYRREEADYKGQPYLVADPDRVTQWSALLGSLGPEPKIGIAWSGGSPLTQQATRRLDLEQLVPLLRIPNVHWVSLEYRDRCDDLEALRARRSIMVHDWPWGTQTDDYDDTAALVASLDLVISVPTTVVHLAGALGVPTWCMVHESPNVHYAGSGGRLAYYGDTVELIRRSDGDWGSAIKTVAGKLSGWLGERKAA